MSEYKIALCGLFEVGAPTLEELDALVEKAIALRVQYGPQLARMAPSGSPSVPSAVNPLATPNVDKWEALAGKRLRMTQGEQDEHSGEFNPREATAKARLLAMGEALAEGSAESAPSVSGALLDGTQVDPDFHA